MDDLFFWESEDNIWSDKDFVLNYLNNENLSEPLHTISDCLKKIITLISPILYQDADFLYKAIKANKKFISTFFQVYNTNQFVADNQTEKFTLSCYLFTAQYLLENMDICSYYKINSLWQNIKNIFFQYQLSELQFLEYYSAVYEQTDNYPLFTNQFEKTELLPIAVSLENFKEFKKNYKDLANTIKKIFIDGEGISQFICTYENTSSDLLTQLNQQITNSFFNKVCSVLNTPTKLQFQDLILSEIYFNNNSDAQLYPYIATEFKEQDRFINVYFVWLENNILKERSQERKYFYYDSNVPITYFQQSKRLFNYFCYFTNESPILKHYQISKELYFDMINQIKTHFYENKLTTFIHKTMPENFWNDIDFIMKFLNPDIFPFSNIISFYKLLPNVFQIDLRIQKQCLLCCGSLKYLINFQYETLTINDLPVLKKIVQDNQFYPPYIFQLLKKSLLLIVASQHNLDTLQISFGDMLNLVKNFPNPMLWEDLSYKTAGKFIHHLPKEYITEDFILLSIKHQNFDMVTPEIQSFDFFIKALEVNIKTIDIIPIDFWKNSYFFQIILNKIDDRSISYQLLELLPNDIKNFFIKYGVKEKHGSFISKFLLNKKLNSELSIKKNEKLHKL